MCDNDVLGFASESATKGTVGLSRRHLLRGLDTEGCRAHTTSTARLCSASAQSAARLSTVHGRKGLDSAQKRWMDSK